MTYKKLKIVSSKLLLNLFFVLACLMALIPILYALSISFTKDASLLSRDFSFIPKKFTLDNYKAVFTEEPVPLWFLEFHIPRLCHNMSFPLYGSACFLCVLKVEVPWKKGNTEDSPSSLFISIHSLHVRHI